MQLVTTTILLQCVILGIILDTDQSAGTWIEKINETFMTNRMGEILINDASEKLPEDISGLMENMKKSPENAYLVFCRIIDVISFLVVLVLFITMFIALFPKGYLSADYDPIESLSP